MHSERLGWTLIHFLWQGTLIGALYAAIRRTVGSPNGRYLLACVALAAMMIAPVVTWLAIGQSDAPHVAPMDQTAKVPANVSPLPVAVESHVPAAPATPWLRWAVAVWLVGAGGLSLRLLGGWTMAARLRWLSTRSVPLEWLQTIERLRQQLGIARAVGLRVSAMVQSPVVIGALRPLILVPVGMLTGLPAAQVEALLLHELAHIRRHDYLVNLLQSIAEALLFYHPAVWWISGHIRTEREHCCDDAAVALTGDMLGYVNALAELAVSQQIGLAAVAANGGSLADRIARLLGEPRPTPRRRGTSLAAVLLVAAAYGVYAQETPRPAFAAASVKLNTAPGGPHMLKLQPGGRLTAQCASLLWLITVAYQVQDYQVIGGPAWLNSDCYDVEAKPESQASRAEMFQMIQSLLADRFKMALHRETHELPVYDLTQTKAGFHPPAAKGDCFQPGDPAAPEGSLCGTFGVRSDSLESSSMQMDWFVKMLARVLARPVIDKTGFTGIFDVHLKFAPDQAPDSDPRPRLFDALQEQMGMKLTSSKGPVEVLAIDHVERPSAN
jgi:uncharacterized protein (TIGR03435 family)